MPNVIRRYAHHFMHQLRRVASSTSPQSPPIPPDPSIASQEHEASQDATTTEEYNRTHESKGFACKLLYFKYEIDAQLGKVELN